MTVRAGVRYLIWGYYGYGNLGDELMLKVIVNAIRASVPESTIYVRCCDNPLTRGIIPFPIDKNVVRIPVLKHLVYLARVIRRVMFVDALVIGGGTLFMDKGRHNQSMFLLSVIVACARIMRKKIYISGVGIDTIILPINMRYLRNILRRSDRCALRDRYSHALAASLISGDRAVRSSDILFDRSFMHSLTSEAVLEKKYVIVNFTDYFLTWGTAAQRELLRQRACELVEMLAREHSSEHPLMLCAFQKDKGERDLEFLQEVLDRIVSKNREYERSIALEYVEDEGQVKRIFASASSVIGMRYHALVLASIFKKPFFGIDMEMKIRQICDDFGMPSLTMEDFLRAGVDGSIFKKLASVNVRDEAVDQAAAISNRNFAWLGRVDKRVS